jgi:hypothetical protein
LNVRTVDKLVLGSVIWSHTIFRFFETFYEDASPSKLHRSTKIFFLDLRIKSYGCLKFLGEVWAGWACVGDNQQELTTCAKSEGRRKLLYFAQGEFGAPGHGRQVIAGRRVTAGWRPAVAYQPRPCPWIDNFGSFWFLNK